MTVATYTQSPRLDRWTRLARGGQALATSVKNASFRVAFVGAFFYSFVMTARGLALIYSPEGGEALDAGDRIIQGMPYVLALALHFGILHVLKNWREGRGRGYWRSVAPLQALAVAVSFGAHWTHFNAAGVTTENFRKAQEIVSRDAQSWVAQYAAFDGQMSALADLSTSRMRDEERDGVSCGGHAGHGQGERYDLRKADLSLFQGLRADVAARLDDRRALADAIDKIAAADAGQAVSEAPALRAAVVRAHALESDPFAEGARQALQARIATGRGAIPIPLSQRRPNGPTTFVCPDAELERRMQAAVVALDAVKPFGDIDLPDLRDARNSYGLAMQRLAASMVHAFGLGATLGDDLATLRDWQALAFAMALEGSLAGFYAGSRSLPNSGGFDALGEALARPRRRRADAAFAAFHDAPDGALRALYEHARFSRSRVYVMIPVDPADDESLALHRLMETLCFARLARPAFAFEPQGLARKFFTWGWTGPTAERLRKARAARRYVMRRDDFCSLSLDALRPEGEQAMAPDAEVVRPFRRTTG